MARRGPQLNRIYIRHEDIALSLYKRGKELSFGTEDVMRLHWDRQGARAKKWAWHTIKLMREKGRVEALDVDPRNPPQGDGRQSLYRITDEFLKACNLYDPNASSSSTTGTFSM